MAGHLFDTKPLPEAMQAYCQSDHSKFVDIQNMTRYYALHFSDECKAQVRLWTHERRAKHLICTYFG